MDEESVNPKEQVADSPLNTESGDMEEFSGQIDGREEIEEEEGETVGGGEEEEEEAEAEIEAQAGLDAEAEEAEAVGIEEAEVEEAEAEVAEAEAEEAEEAEAELEEEAEIEAEAEVEPEPESDPVHEDEEEEPSGEIGKLEDVDDSESIIKTKLIEKLEEPSMEVEEQGNQEIYHEKEAEVLMAVDQAVESPEHTAEDAETDSALDIQSLLQENTAEAEAEESIGEETNAIATEPLIAVSNLPVEHLAALGQQNVSESEAESGLKAAALAEGTDTLAQAVIKSQIELQVPDESVANGNQSLEQLQSPPSQTEDVQLPEPALTDHLTSPNSEISGSSTVASPSVLSPPLISKADSKLVSKLKIKSEPALSPSTAADAIAKQTQLRLVSQTKVDSKTTAGAEDLATLAIAALTRNQTSNGVSTTGIVKKDPIWCDVGVIKGTSSFVSSYYEPNYSHDQEHESLTIDSSPDFSEFFKIELEPGTAYKFRVAAINSCGRGPWSEVSAFKTCLPGYPGAPSSIKISKSSEGAHLSWESPPNPAGNIIEYSVCLAVRNSSQPQGEQKTHQLAFVRVYSGPHSQTVVPNASLAAAHIDTTSKPAIIFRIAAKNEKGFGPATQVRWLQDVVVAPGGTLKTFPKKDPMSPPIPLKRPKIDEF